MRRDRVRSRSIFVAVASFGVPLLCLSTHLAVATGIHLSRSDSPFCWRGNLRFAAGVIGIISIVPPRTRTGTSNRVKTIALRASAEPKQSVSVKRRVVTCIPGHSLSPDSVASVVEEVESRPSSNLERREREHFGQPCR